MAEIKKAHSAAATAEQANNQTRANKSVFILSDTMLDVKEQLRLKQIREATGIQAKDASVIIQEIFPKFSRQLMAACENPEQYGVLIHPAAVLHYLKKIGADYPNAPAVERPPGNKPLSQCDRIIRHLREYGYMTALDAFRDYGITNMRGRIWDLRQRGYDISTNMVTGKNRYGEPTRYSIYILEGEPNAPDT